jgi:hypothetical protein
VLVTLARRPDLAEATYAIRTRRIRRGSWKAACSSAAAASRAGGRTWSWLRPTFGFLIVWQGFQDDGFAVAWEIGASES